jgi:OOP family OmpA-OmpF porin
MGGLLKQTLRRSLGGALAALLLVPLAAMPADPSVQEMIDALAPKPSASTQGVGVLTRSLRRSATPAAPTREGRLQLSVQFEYASAAISPQSRELLSRLAAAMKAPALAQLRYRIEGHTDITGSVPRNQSLSERRAQSVAEFLKGASGVGAGRLNTIGLGSSAPANPNDLKAAENRRVVIVSVEAAPESATPDDGAGTVQRVQGALYVRREGVTTSAKTGSRVREGDVLSTPAAGAALVRFDDGANVLLRSDTTVEFRKLRMTGEPGRMGQVMELLVGALRFVSGAFSHSRPESVAFVTQTATLGLRGTDFDMVYAGQYSADDPGTYVKVNDGGVAMGGVDGSTVELAKDEQAFAGNPKVLTRSLRKGPAAVKLDAPSKVFSTGDLDGLLAGK